jgi:hypothetical protein
MAMDASDKDIIRRFAAGDQTLRDEAIRIYRVRVRIHGLCRGQPYFDFMSEVDNPCPDLLLRARYREQVLQGPL